MACEPTSSPVRAEPGLTTVLLVVFLVALGLRAGWGIYQLTRAEDPTVLEFPDEVQYWSMAQSLRAGEGLQDELGFRAARMPLYPGLLALFTPAEHGVIYAKVLHWVIGALAAAVTAWLAATMFDRRAAWLAGLMLAFDPFMVFFSSLLLTETLFVTAIVLLWGVGWPILRAGGKGVSAWRWLAAGLLTALCVYVRVSSLGLMVAVVALWLVAGHFRRQVLLGGAGVLLVVVLALLPWALRNQRVTGHLCWLTHRGGISLYDGVGPQAQGDSNLGGIKQMPAVRGLDEVQWNRYFMHESLKAMRDDPGRILRLALVKWSRMWNPLPNVETYRSPFVRLISAAWTLPTFAFATAGAILLGLRRREQARGRALLWLLGPALYLTALHGLFVGSVRYRLGAIPMLEVLAAVALVALWKWLAQRREAAHG